MEKTELLESLKETLERTEERVSSLKRQLKSYDNCLVSHQWVAKVGMYTVGTDSNRMLQLSFKTLPSLWTEEGIEEIAQIQKERHIFKNMRKEPMKVEKVWFKDYYRDEIAKQEQFLESQKQILDNFQS